MESSIQPFLSALTNPPIPQDGAPQDDISPLVLATIIDRLSQDPPQDWGERQSEDLIYAIKMRYQTLRTRIPQAVETAMYLDDLLKSPESRLAKVMQRAGPRATSSIEACKEMLAGVETSMISYLQIANALLFSVMAENGGAYDAAILVRALKEHRAGSMVDWLDVVQGFDKPDLRITKKQFLALYNSLLPLARESDKFDIQTLWGKNWQYPTTQLSFVVAFLSTGPEELDVTQIPNLRRAFTVEDYEDASDSIKVFAAEAVKHPLVSKDATEALFVMIFRSQEAYNEAQMLGIPDTLINPNMPIFLSAASAVDKPWGPLQDQALKQLFYPFIAKQHQNYDFVLYTLWKHDKMWVATRLVEFYQQNNMLLLPIYEHAEEQGWLEQLLTIQSPFVIDLAAYAHSKGQCDLAEWSQGHVETMGEMPYVRVLLDFIHQKIEDENRVQRDLVQPTTVPLALKTVYAMLRLMSDLVGDENLGHFYRQCLSSYPRLFNYGEDEKIDKVLDAQSANGHALPDEVGSEMEQRYKSMYGAEISPDAMISELKELKISEDPRDQDLFAAMLQGLFDEYHCFGEYPNEALATTAVLFGGLLQFNVLGFVSEQAAIHMVFESVTETTIEDQMFKFGLQAMVHLLGRLREWPQLAERIVRIPNLRNTQAWPAAESVLKELEQETTGLNGDSVNGVTNGGVDEGFPTDSSNPPFLAIHVDPPLRPELYEDPDEEVSDKVMFVLNNVSKRNLDEKFKALEGTLEEKHHQWFAHYLVEELAKSQPNFQGLYLQLLESFNKGILWAEVLRETFVSCAKMLNAPSTMESSSERTNLKNLAGWLGALTLARNQPILHRNLSFKDLLIEGHETQRLLIAIPFTCKTLVHAAESKVFRPPNPWLMELLGLLSELYHNFELKLNLKFEIEVLCKDLNLDIKSIQSLDLIRARQLVPEDSMLQPYIQESGPEGFGDVHLIGLSKRGPNERFSPEVVLQALPDLSNVLVIPPASGNVSVPQMRNIFVNAAQQAIYEIIAPVVERSVTIAAISTAELVQKDFATESDIEKLRSSAHTVVKALSGSLALVTCKEPLRMSIMNNIRLLAQRTLQEQLPEGQIIMFVNDNIDRVCSLVESAAEEHSLAEIDAQLGQAIEDRRRHNEQRPNEPYNHPPVSRWAQMIPEPFRQDPQGINASGLNRQQLSLYEDFGRQVRIMPTAHGNNASQDARQLPDVLSDNYLPNLPTPAEAPAMPRQTPQQHRMQIVQHAQGQDQVNGYADTANMGNRILALMQELQHAAREAGHDHIAEIGERSSVREIYDQLILLIEHNVQKDHFALAAGQQCLIIISSQAQKRLEVEIFAHMLNQLCRMSVHASRNLFAYLANTDDDSFLKADVSASLMSENLLDVMQVDSMAAKALRARRPVVLDYLKDLLDEVLLNGNPNILRVDFALTYEALGQWISEDPSNEQVRDILKKLQISNPQENGMPSPQEQSKQDQLEYIFEEWVQLQRKEAPERSSMAFLRQLYEQNIVAQPESAIVFFRACLELSATAFERVTATPYGTPDAAYIHIDALAKLMAMMVIYQSPIDGETQPSKGKVLDAMIRLVILVMNEHHNKQRERFPARVYFRLFSSLLCELRAGRAHLNDQQDFEVHRVFALALRILQPQYFSGFTYPWLALLSHRLLVPAFLNGAGRLCGGWDTFTELLVILFQNLGGLIGFADGSLSIQDFYRGTIRFLLMLHHDYPEYLIENHVQLNSSIPKGCAQLHNIINSAVTRAAVNDQPDPFTPGLKINRLDQVRQAPLVSTNINKILTDAGVADALERVCSTQELSNDDYNAIANVLSALDDAASPLVANAMVVYIGVQMTSASSVFSSAAASARLLERLLRDVGSAVRYDLICAMINQVRYVNAHTHYFSTALQHMFTIGTEEMQEQIMRVVVERLMAPRPHPWGLIVMILELIKNPSYDIWSLTWMKTAPQVQNMLEGLVQNQDRLARSGGFGVGIGMM